MRFAAAHRKARKCVKQQGRKKIYREKERNNHRKKSKSSEENIVQFLTSVSICIKMLSPYDALVTNQS
jgi:hypothetical protein